MTTTFDYAADVECGPLAGVYLTNGRQSRHPQAGDVLVFDATVVGGKRVTPMLKLAGKSRLQVAWAAHEKFRVDAEAVAEAALHAAVPGLRELWTALDAEERYEVGFARMMKDESNDGVRPPKSLTGPTSRELRVRYPLAALYVRAEGYRCAANDRKASAGSRAIEMLRAGVASADVERVLENWLSDSAYTD